MLFSPWRNENNLKNQFSSFEESWSNYVSNLDPIFKLDVDTFIRHYLKLHEDEYEAYEQKSRIGKLSKIDLDNDHIDLDELDCFQNEEHS